MPSVELELIWLFALSLPVACAAWTVTHEEVFREPREYCARRCKQGKSLAERKFFYLFTCEYCFSHYVSLFFVLLCDYRLLLPDWRGVLIAWLAIVFTANVYMSLFALLRQAIKKEKVEIEELQNKVASEEGKDSLLL